VLVGNSVPILLQKPFSFVRNIESVVRDGEGCVTKPRLLEHVFRLGLCNLGIELLEKRCIRSSREARLLIQKRQHAQLALYDIDTRLIVGKFDEFPVNLFFDIFLLFEFEYVCIKLPGSSDDAGKRE